MLNLEIIKTIFDLKLQNKTISEITKLTNVDRGTVRSYLKRNSDDVINSITTSNYHNPAKSIISEDQQKCYSYILGLYLGDGCIHKHPRTYRLRIFLHRDEIDIQNQTVKCLTTLFPKNKISIYPQKQALCTEVSVYSTALINIFPQHGVGKKNSRSIELLDWQKSIVEKYSDYFITGLYDSDGSGYYNSGKYLYYQFTNTSEDIANLFKQYLGFYARERIQKRILPQKNAIIVSMQNKTDSKRFQDKINTVYDYFHSTRDERKRLTFVERIDTR